MTMTAEKRTFDTEVQELLNLMVYSLYSNKDIFLRELISNSSDALDRLRLEALTNTELMPKEELHIRLEVDKDKRTLAVHDNGIGMSREELIRDIGTIARSGTQHFVAAAKANASTGEGEGEGEGKGKGKGDGGKLSEDLIGQFGVGFYSTFMVSKKVTIITRRAGEETASKWESSGDGTYTIEEGSRSQPGTTVLLELKEADEEDGLKDYAAPWVLKDIVKKHSDFVSHPIRMLVERQEPVLDDKGVPVKDAIPRLIKEEQTLNSMKAIWTRPRSEVTEDEYKEFYRHISRDWGDPLETISASLEGAFNARLLLFIPEKAPFDLYTRDQVSRGLQLYVKRVFIKDDWEALLPEWLRFVKGVIDSEDLSLNVSREILQQDRQVKAIRKFATKKILDAILKIKDDRPEDMKKLWKEFGAVLKEGLAGFDDSKDRILDLVMCRSTHGDEPTYLSGYVERMKEEQKGIYYLTGPSLEAIQSSPHLEAFKAKGIEVLFFSDPIDEFWLQGFTQFKEKSFISVGKGEVDFDAEADKTEAEKKKTEIEKEQFKDLLQCLRAHLQDELKEVRLSARLTDSPVCLVGDTHDMSKQMEEMMRRMGREVPKTKRILEVNPDHPFIEKLRGVCEADKKSTDLKTYAKLLYGQAILAEGGELPDPNAYSRIIMEVANKAVEVS
ncbi:MAG: molecular chaperone HtpG [Deltaproteobacteria bacterium RIFOXYA12_FULL_58_15]|nr:MAG: molecular chaperone HtpG [Deltaproteobacteria bacterium RIFOXYA12_FULL_58_15]